MLLLPADGRKKGVTARSASKTRKFLDRAVKDLLAVLGIDIQHIDHRAQYAHRVGLGGLTGIQFALFGDHSGNDPRVYPGLLGDTEDLFIAQVGRIKGFPGFIGLVHLGLDDRSNFTEHILGIVTGLRAQGVQDIPRSIRSTAALRQGGLHIVDERADERVLGALVLPV